MRVTIALVCLFLGFLQITSQAEKHESENISTESSNFQTDYEISSVNLTNFVSSVRSSHGQGRLVVETLVVVDKEFADVFQHDRKQIIDYLTTYFWDVNMRFKTLPSVNLSFRVTGVMIISTTEGQPFIENSRASNGKAELRCIAGRFNNWVKENLESLPKFDISVLITNTNLEWNGGWAYTSSACQNSGSAVFHESGKWDVALGAHEIAHTLGAPHDVDSPDCTATGYLMSAGGKYDEKRWFFSECSDRHIHDFVNSNQAKCLRQIDQPENIPINEGFNDVLMPSKDEQCKRVYGSTAYADPDHLDKCHALRCRVPTEGDRWWWYEWNSADNSPCEYIGRCFRGRCRDFEIQIKNVGTGDCIKAPNPFHHNVRLELSNCPGPLATPLDGFTLSDGGNNRIFLKTPWQSRNGQENGERCIWTGLSEGDGLWTSKCSEAGFWHGWDLVLLQDWEFMLQHQATKRCAKDSGSYISTHEFCNENDRNMRWTYANLDALPVMVG